MRVARNVRTLAIALAVVGAMPARRAQACASCGCGDQTLTATGVEQPYTNRVRVGAEARYGSFSLGADDVAEHVQFVRTSLVASWSPVRRVTVSALLPWVSSWLDHPGTPRTSINGLGDLELAARGVVFEDRGFAPHHVLWLGGGLKFPTGYRAYDSTGFPAADDDQPGSGSWDPFAGVTYGWFSGGLLSFFASTAGRLTTPGWHGYRRGSSIGGSLAVQLQPWAWGAFQLGADLLWAHADALANGNAVPNTGGTTGYLAAAAMVNPWRDLLVRVVVDAPVVTALDGTQTVGPQVALQVSYDFN